MSEICDSTCAGCIATPLTLTSRIAERIIDAWSESSLIVKRPMPISLP